MILASHGDFSGNQHSRRNSSGSSRPQQALSASEDSADGNLCVTQPSQPTSSRL